MKEEVGKNFFDSDIKTPSWDRFKSALEKHIEYLKEAEKTNPGFKCDCSVCNANTVRL